jgi:hypothetical protein
MQATITVMSSSQRPASDLIKVPQLASGAFIPRRPRPAAGQRDDVGPCRSTGLSGLTWQLIATEPTRAWPGQDGPPALQELTEYLSHGDLG